jgi:hypothetical protein
VTVLQNYSRAVHRAGLPLSVISTRTGTGLAAFFCFFWGFALHFLRPFSYGAGALGTGVFDRVTIADYAMLMCAFVLLLDGAVFISDYIAPWLAFAALMLLNAMQPEYTGWGAMIVECGAILSGVFLTSALANGRCLHMFSKGFIAGYFVLLGLLYFDAVMLLTGHSLVYGGLPVLRGPFYLSTQLGRHLSFCIFMLFGPLRWMPGPFTGLVRSGWWLAVPVLLLSGARTALATTILGFALLALVHNDLGLRKRVLLGGAVAALGVLLMFTQLRSSYLERIAGRWAALSSNETEPGEGFFSLQTSTVLAAFLDHPLFGIGKGEYEKSKYSPFIAGEQYEIHNAFLATLAETGIVGVLVFAIALISAGQLSFRMLKQGPPSLAPVAAFVLASFASGVHGIFYRERGFWVAFAMLMAYAATRRSIVPSQNRGQHRSRRSAIGSDNPTPSDRRNNQICAE